MNTIQPEQCQVCGDIGIKDSIMTCFNCREVREHIYCAKIQLQSVPDMWICEVCRSSTRVLQLSNRVNDNTIESCALEPEVLSKSSDSNEGSRLHGLKLLAHKEKKQSLMSNDTSPVKKQRKQFLAFPSPKRKRRTSRLKEDTEETKRQGTQSSFPCVFHRL